MAPTFSINFDYRCPFARNANEHVLVALAAGAPYEVSFLGFSLTAIHAQEGDPSVFEDPAKRPDLLALAAGIAVRDNDPDRFAQVHLSLFAARHDDGNDLRDLDVVKGALAHGGTDPDVVMKQLEEGMPFATLRAEHEAAVARDGVFGVPTFVLGDEAVFVRLVTRPQGDRALARTTVDNVLAQLSGHPELNEYKHTTIRR